MATPARAGGGGLGVEPGLVWQAIDATRDAAIAAARWAGRGEPKAADAAATAAMRDVLGRGASAGVVVTGEGAKDDAPMLADGEWLGARALDDGGAPGSGEEAGYDIAVDPLECTDLCAAGLPGAMATIAIAPRGSMWSPGPAFYMDKLVVPAAARAAVSLDEEPEQILARVAEALGTTEPLRVVVLDKPRHRELIDRLRAAGACVRTPSAGDVAGALQVMLPDGDAELLLGIGGTPEGVMAACAARALGAGIWGRLAPQSAAEQQAIKDAGLSTARALGVEELVSADATFIATGVTGGLLAGPRHEHGLITTESLVIARGAIRFIRHTTSTEE
jgi:fructose-1,6-bisphosphatase II